MLSDEEAFRLVCRRGELMDKAAKDNPGAMLAVMKLPADGIEQICSGFDSTYPVNYNSPAQTVVATSEENAEPLQKAFADAGGRAKRLAVSGAFHSPFMASAASDCPLPWKPRLRRRSPRHRLRDMDVRQAS